MTTAARPAKSEMFKVERTTATSCDAFGGQQTFFYLQQESPNHPSMWLLGGLLLEGPLDHARLERSLHELVRRHSVYRTGLEEAGRGKLRQQVLPFDAARHVSLQITDVSALEPAEQASAQDAIFEQLRCGDNDLANGPGIRGHLILLAPERSVLALGIHHVAGDGAQMSLLQAELGRLYGGAATEDRPLCFIDFAASIVQWMGSSGGQAERAYWRERLAGAPPLELPVDRPRAAVDARRDAVPFGFASEPMSTVGAQLSEEARTSITAMASAEGTTANIVYLAGLAHVLQGLTGQTDLCIDTAHSHRMGRPMLEQVHGCLTSPRVMRIDASGTPTWKELVPRTKKVVLDAYRRCWVPIIDLAPHSVRRLLFNYLPQPLNREFDFAPNVKARSITPKLSDAWRRHWDMQLLVIEHRRVLLLYSTTLFEKATAQMILDKYVSLIESAAS